MRLPETVKFLLEYGGISAFTMLVLYLVFWSAIKNKLLGSLTQKRKVFIIVLVTASIWSIGILGNFKNKEAGEKDFFYSGQIINEKGYPISKAFAFIVLGNDTIKSLTQTGYDGNFTIRLDTVQGIKTILYYGHSDYGINTVFRALNSSTNEQFVLKKATVDRPLKKTFSINMNNDSIISIVERSTGLKYKISNADYVIDLQYEKEGFESFDDRCRYLGGKVLVNINKRICCESTQSIKPTNAAGYNLTELEKQLQLTVRNIVMEEKEPIVKKISACIKKHS